MPAAVGARSHHFHLRIIGVTRPRLTDLGSQVHGDLKNAKQLPTEYTFRVFPKSPVVSAPDKNRTRFVWPLLAGWVVIAIVAVAISVPRAEDELAGDARQALQEAGIAAQVEFSGRDATLSGDLAPADQELALEVVRGVTGVREARWRVSDAAPGPTTIAPVQTTSTTAPSTTSTSASTDPPGSAAPASLNAILSRGALELSGTLPSAEIAAQVAAVANLIYGPFVTNDLQVDESVAAGSWLPGAPNLMAFLPIVGEADLRVVGNEATLTGTAGSAEKKGQLEAALGAALGSEVTLTSAIEVTDRTPPVYLAEAPGDGTVTLSGIMPDQSAIDMIVDAAVEVFGEPNVTDSLTIGTDVDTTFSLFRIPLTFAQFAPIPEWELQIENDVITGSVRGGATFGFGSAELTPELRVLLETGAGILLRNPSIAMTIEGHTDSVGSDAFNLALSNARAQAGADYLVELGVDPGRLIAVGYGETRPIADNGTPEGRTKNRRLEFALGPPS